MTGPRTDGWVVLVPAADDDPRETVAWALWDEHGQLDVVFGWSERLLMAAHLAPLVVADPADPADLDDLDDLAAA